MAQNKLAAKYLKAAWKTPGANKSNALKRAWAMQKKARGGGSKRSGPKPVKKGTKKAARRTVSPGGRRMAKKRRKYISILGIIGLAAAYRDITNKEVPIKSLAKAGEALRQYVAKYLIKAPSPIRAVVMLAGMHLASSETNKLINNKAHVPIGNLGLKP